MHLSPSTDSASTDAPKALAEHLLAEADKLKRLEHIRCHQPDLETLAQLKQLVDHYKHKDEAKAHLAGERAFELGQWLDQPEALALGSWALALGLTVNGQFEAALPHFERARALYLHLANPVDAARVATRQVQALAMLGDFASALALALKTRTLFQAKGLAQEAAQVTNNIGAIHIRLGHLSEAETFLLEARRAFKNLGLAMGVAQAHINLGYVYQELDRFLEARDHLQQATTILEQLGASESLAGTMVNLAALYRRQGHPTKVLEVLSRARLFYRESESVNGSLVRLEQARIHLDLNLLVEAEALAQDLSDNFARKKMAFEQAEALTVLGTAQARAGKAAAALETLTEAQGQLVEQGNEMRAALVGLYIAALHFGVTPDDPLYDIARARELAQTSVVTLERGGRRVHYTFGLLVLTEACLAAGNLDLAKVHLTKATALARSLEVPDLIIRACRRSGLMALQDGDEMRAATFFDEAIEVLESVRASLSVDELKASYVGDKLAVYDDMVRLQLRDGQAAKAFAYAERAKSRALLDLLSLGAQPRVASKDPTALALQEHLQKARQTLNWHYLKAEDEGRQGPHWQKVVEAEHEVTQLLHDLENLSPEAAAFEQVSILDIEGFIETLEPDTLLIEYFGDDELIAFVVGQGRVRATKSVMPAEQVQKHLSRYRFFLTRTAQDGAYAAVYSDEALKKQLDRHLQALYEGLIAPLNLGPEIKRLMIVPHAQLHGVPFPALYDGAGYLLEHKEIALAPSASIFDLCLRKRMKPQAEAMAFGVPSDDIPAVRDELRQIQNQLETLRIFSKDDATLANFFERAPEASLLHIASHGLYRPDNPMFSGLRFADGWLSVRDLYSVDLQASLVVLSACETGLASRAAGDEMLGLARGFLFAGTPALIGSLWPVKDRHTAILMGYFYDALCQGAGVAEALRKAQIRLMAEHPNPYYWAAFAVFGDPFRKGFV